MSKFNWRNGFASGLIVGSVLVVLLCVAVGLATATIDPTTSGNACGGAGSYDCADNSEQVPYGWYWLRRAFAVEDTIAQWVMMAFTIAAAFLLLSTLKTTQGMARDTRDIGQKQARAYLFLQFGDVEFNVVDNKDGSNLVVKIGVNLTNSGSTPGYSPIIYYDIQEAVRSEIIPQPQPENMKSSPINTSFIPAKGKSKTNLSRTWRVDDPIAFQGFKDRLVRFSYCVNFLDEFEEDRWTPIISGTFHHWPEGSISFLPDKLHETADG